MNDSAQSQSSWDSIEAWIKPLREKYFGELLSLVENSQEKLKNKKITEPAYRDWSNFRPLNPEVENDWSDWLAHILETAPTGYFAKELLNKDSDWILTDYKAKRVERETSIPGLAGGEKNFRTDLLIYLIDETKHIHIEVKLDDSNFEKTRPTSKSLNLYLKDNNTKHFILVPKYRENECRAKLNTVTGDYPKINVITWNDVADSLRNTLFNEEINNLDNKHTEWNVWASSFLGCIEQKLLGFANIPENKEEHKKYSIYSLIKNLHVRGKKMAPMENIFFKEGFTKYLELQNTIDDFERMLREHIIDIPRNVLRENGFEERSERKGLGVCSTQSKIQYFYEDIKLEKNKKEIQFQYGLGWFKKQQPDHSTFIIYVMFFKEPYMNKETFKEIKEENQIYVQPFWGERNKEYILVKKYKEINSSIDFENDFKIIIDELVKVCHIQ